MRGNYLIIFMGLVIAMNIKLSSAAKFGYKPKEQRNWDRKFPNCNGKRQSPISLSSRKAEILPLRAIEMIGYHDYLNCPLSLKNDGHTVVLNFDRIQCDKNQLPYIFGAKLNVNQKYGLEGLHFHWGKENKRGSEHTVNGLRYPMEMHIVHRNLGYPTLEIAQKKTDGLSVVAVLFQLQEEDNDMLNPILENLHSLKSMGDEVHLNTSIVLSSILPKNTDVYYTYKGSLTTPPCYEVVSWIIFSETVPISPEQMSQFRLLRDEREDILGDNYRELQDILNRKVYLRKLKPTRLQDDSISCNITCLESSDEK